MNLKLSLAIFCSFVLLVPAVVAQVPQLINYQGRVIVGTTNFDGAGQFKFALVNATGTTAYWTNDGTHLDGTEPTDAVTLTVSNGLYSVLLGDTSLTHMIAIPNALFDNPDIRLRVWFNNQTNGSQQLVPDQRIASAGYAAMGGNVSDGAITSDKFAQGAVGLTQLASGAVAGNLAQSGQSVVAPGGVILSTADNAALIAAGYVKLATITMADGWQGRSNVGAPSARADQTAVWTGSEMIVWGGNDNNTGGRYNPASNSWIATATSGAPAARSSPISVWTGSEMIVWGGNDNNTGGRYNPASNSWIATAATAAPAARSGPTAVWTGSQMIIWGGASSTGSLRTGALYNPSSDSWSATTTTGAPAARYLHTAVWTGTEMIVWGGLDYDRSTGTFTFFGSGARYNPASNTWTPTGNTGAAAARCGHTTVWTGNEMIVWGGQSNSVGNLTSGGRYNPGSNSWSPTSTTNVPLEGEGHTAVWTSSEMIVWGGANSAGSTNTYLNSGGRYNPASDSWAATITSNAPLGRYYHTAIWTGSEMIVWGGYNQGEGVFFNDTFSYTPPKLMVLYQRP